MAVKFHNSHQTNCRGRDLTVILFFGLVMIALSSLSKYRHLLAGQGPEWVLILTLYVSLRAELWMATLAAFILGSLRGAVSVDIDGLFHLQLIMSVLVTRFLSRRMNLAVVLPMILYIFVLGLFLNLVFTPFFLDFLLPSPFHSFNTVNFRVFAISASVTAILSPVIFRLLDYTNFLLDRQQKS